MEKEDLTKILQAILLLFDNVSKEEIEKSIEKKYVSCAEYFMKFIKSFNF